MSAVYTSELANGLGNLASRVTAMVGRYFDGLLPEPGEPGPAEAAVAAALSSSVAAADDAMGRVAIHEAVSATADFVSTVNGYVTEQEPWKVAKDTSPAARVRLGTILYAAAEALRAVAVLHNPVMPRTSAALWQSLGADHIGPLADQRICDAGRWGQLPAGVTVTKGAVLFPRLDERP
jgi:methionyl-tRNA synthetase